MLRRKLANMVRKRTTLTLDPRVVQYLEDLANQNNRSRSFMAETILVEHANTNGKQIKVEPNLVARPLEQPTRG
jgi:predicted transcriptional regulator